MMSKPASSTTSIVCLFALWQVQNRKALDYSLPEAEMNAASDAAHVIAQQIDALQPETAQDFAMKFVVNTLEGSLCPSDAFNDAARRLAECQTEGA